MSAVSDSAHSEESRERLTEGESGCCRTSAECGRGWCARSCSAGRGRERWPCREGLCTPEGPIPGGAQSCGPWSCRGICCGVARRHLRWGKGHFRQGPRQCPLDSRHRRILLVEAHHKRHTSPSVLEVLDERA